MSRVLDVRHLCLEMPGRHPVARHIRILDDISFSVPHGQAVAYIGANGAGKSSTFRVLTGLARHWHGDIRFHGQPVRHGLPPRRIGYLPELARSQEYLTGGEWLRHLGGMLGLDAARLETSIRYWTERLDVSELLDRPLRRCSKGQAQRLALVQALLHEPELLLLDEPLSGLDPWGREQVTAVLREQLDQGRSILVSSHLWNEIQWWCDQVVALAHGRIVFQGGMQALRARATRWRIIYRGHLPQMAAQPLAGDRFVVEADSRDHRDRLLQRIQTSPQASLEAVEPTAVPMDRLLDDMATGNREADP